MTELRRRAHRPNLLPYHWLHSWIRLLKRPTQPGLLRRPQNSPPVLTFSHMVLIPFLCPCVLCPHLLSSHLLSSHLLSPQLLCSHLLSPRFLTPTHPVLLEPVNPLCAWLLPPCPLTYIINLNRPRWARTFGPIFPPMCSCGLLS